MSIPRRLGRLAQGFVSSLQTDDRFRDRLVRGRERSEALRDAFEAAWRGASEEWRRAEERRMAEEAAQQYGGRTQDRNSGWRAAAPTFAPLGYPANVLAAYNRLGLAPGASMTRWTGNAGNWSSASIPTVSPTPRSASGRSA